ncbi:MAG: hypothetical protein LH485_05245 [Sphingomonas bacterium]|nr:hypothetical protein [Sphingomonas bacterium]
MCADPDFDLRDSGLALIGTVPVSAALIRTMTFSPGDAPAPNVAGVSRAGDRQLFTGSARVAVGRNGKVSGCVETASAGGLAGALCRLVTAWLFRIDPDRTETRSGVWTIMLSSRSGPPQL